MNLKEILEKNRLLQLRVLELNEIIRDLSKASDEATSQVQGANAGDSQEEVKSRKIIKLREENESLRRQLSMQNPQRRSSKVPKEADEEDEDNFDQNSFLQGIQVAENIHSSMPLGEDNNNMFDQSSLLNVIEDLAGDTKQGSSHTNQQ